MPVTDCFIMMGMGGLFLILGLILVIWGKSRQKSYNESLPTLSDVRGHLEQDAEPKSVSLKVGGWITIAVGLLLLAMGGAFWFWG